MEYNKMTYLDLLDERLKINNAINEYDERLKQEVYTVKANGESEHYESPLEAANMAIETIQRELNDEEDLISLFEMGVELKTTKFNQAEIKEFVIMSNP